MVTARQVSSHARRPVQGRRERRKIEIRQRLFRAALELFAVKGFSSTTVEDITQAADVGKGTFFNYFPTKEYLLAEWVELRLDFLRGALAETEEDKDTVRDILRRLFFDINEEPSQSPVIARCMLLGLLGSEPLATLAQKTAAKAREILSEIMSAGQQRGEIRRDVSARDLAYLFQQTFFGFVHLGVLLPNQKLSARLNTSFELFWAAAQPVNSRKSTK